MYNNELESVFDNPIRTHYFVLVVRRNQDMASCELGKCMRIYCITIIV